ncbi:hypothetical protein SGPA1_10897 [Streptomyces misionensis JCM 4497]
MTFTAGPAGTVQLHYSQVAWA